MNTPAQNTNPQTDNVQKTAVEAAPAQQPVQKDGNTSPELTPEEKALVDKATEMAKTGTLDEIVHLLALDILIVGATYLLVRTISRAIGNAYDLEPGLMQNMIEAAVSAALGVPASVLANKGIAALTRKQQAAAVLVLRQEAQRIADAKISSALQSERNRAAGLINQVNGMSSELDALGKTVVEIRDGSAVTEERLDQVRESIANLNKRMTEKTDEDEVSVTTETDEPRRPNKASSKKEWAEYILATVELDGEHTVEELVKNNSLKELRKLAA